MEAIEHALQARLLPVGQQVEGSSCAYPALKLVPVSRH